MNRQKQIQSDSRTRILDTAERLFALNGFKGTSIKHLAEKAGVNQAAVNYYFGSKAALIKNVIERRMQPVNQERMENLNAVQQTARHNGCRPSAENVLRAFVEPGFAQNKIMAHEKCLMAIASRAFYEPDVTIRNAFIKQVKPPLMLLLRVMKEALPDMPDEVLSLRLHFAIGAMTHCMKLCSGSLPPDDFLPPACDLKTMMNQLVDFVTSGLCAPCLKKER